MDVEAILLAFPGLLHKLELDDNAICDLFQRHLAPTKDAKKLTAKKLLQQGSITVADGDLFPIAIGDLGASIGYGGGNITERDVFTVNGVIHYLNSVIVEDPPPPPPHENGVCSLDECENNPELAQECQDFLTICLQGADTGADREQCVGAALLKCVELF